MARQSSGTCLSVLCVILNYKALQLFQDPDQGCRIYCLYCDLLATGLAKAIEQIKQL